MRGNHGTCRLPCPEWLEQLGRLGLGPQTLVGPTSLVGRRLRWRLRRWLRRRVVVVITPRGVDGQSVGSPSLSEPDEHLCRRVAPDTRM